MAQEISSMDDMIDSRDVIARIEELTDTLTDEEITDKQEREEIADEIQALETLQKEAEGYSEDWTFGATLIRDSHFTQYAQDFADDIGAIQKDRDWPNSCIDWEQAASELQMDYTEVDFDGVAYWVR